MDMLKIAEYLKCLVREQQAYQGEGYDREFESLPETRKINRNLERIDVQILELQQQIEQLVQQKNSFFQKKRELKDEFDSSLRAKKEEAKVSSEDIRSFVKIDSLSDVNVSPGKRVSIQQNSDVSLKKQKTEESNKPKQSKKNSIVQGMLQAVGQNINLRLKKTQSMISLQSLNANSPAQIQSDSSSLISQPQDKQFEESKGVVVNNNSNKPNNSSIKPKKENEELPADQNNFIFMIYYSRDAKQYQELIFSYLDLRGVIFFSHINRHCQAMMSIGYTECIKIWDIIEPKIKLLCKDEEEFDEVFDEAQNQYSLFSALEYVAENTIPNKTGWRLTAKNAMGKSRTEGVEIIELKNILEDLSDEQVEEILNSEKVKNMFLEDCMRMPQDKQDIDSDLISWRDDFRSEFFKIFN